MSATHIELDLETLGLEHGSMVVSVGAVVFDPERPELEPGGDLGQFHEFLLLDDQKKAGLSIDPATVMWWMGQEDAARLDIVDGYHRNTLPVHIALSMLSEWMEQVSGEALEPGKPLTVKVWGNGANFDPPMLREVYRRFGINCPWAWYNERCHRSVCKAYRELLWLTAEGTGDEPQFQGTQHNALEDALHQARVLTYLYNRVRKRVVSLT